MIMYRQVTIMLLFRRSGVLELGACRMANEYEKLDEYGVTKVTGMNACGSYGVEKGSLATIKVGLWKGTWIGDMVPWASSFI